MAQLGVMTQRARTDATTELSMRPSAATIALATLLAAVHGELERLVADELARNPALTRREGRPCPACGRWLVTGRCRSCSGPRTAREAADVVAVTSPIDALEAEVRLGLPAGDHGVLRAVLSAVDTNGLLAATPDDLARSLHVAPEVVARVVRALRDTAPPGFAAETPLAALVAQLDAHDPHAPIPRLARRMLTECTDDVADGRLGTVAAALAVPVSEVEAALDWMRAHVSPTV